MNTLRCQARALPWRAPEDVLVALAPVYWHGLAFLDSSDVPGARSRYSYLCLSPIAQLRVEQGCTLRDGVPVAEDGFAALSRLLAEHRQAPSSSGQRPDPALPPFLGGVVGLLGYGMAHALERLPRRHVDTLGLPDMAVAVYDLVIAFDRVACRCWLTGPPNKTDGVAARWPLVTAAPAPASQRLDWSASLAPDAYAARVAQVIAAIRAGDIFQANFTARHLAPRPDGLDPVALYRRLRRTSPAPFAAYLDLGEGCALLSASPERFLHLDAQGQVETRPIKGTAARHANRAADASARAVLAASGKDRAENLMIVDLMRNDLGRVCAIGSVRVPQLNAVESFASVHHLVSSVTGTLAPGEDAVSLLRACFPGGSVTGAPKIRAMQVIDALEVAARGAYCGSVVRIGWDGAMDSSIVIRSLMLGRTHVAAHAGGGITAESDPVAEYEEARLKLAPLLGP